MVKGEFHMTRERSVGPIRTLFLSEKHKADWTKPPNGSSLSWETSRQLYSSDETGSWFEPLGGRAAL